MPKPDIHPKWYPEAKVYCNGEIIMTVGSTKPELHVDVWSGNHPYYTGTQKIIDTEGRVERFMRKYSNVAVNKSQTAAKTESNPAKKTESKKSDKKKKK
ncbi:MAG: 50S ribosomal protein L31 [Oscillatoriaceae bacterium SKW80]|nr:50S ribosomal protein L31 [Oscillatoriaceae bacterium SKYG93]MCX8121258.1 50S ribosomal protein L31 [Oscillatoriaceae bacterium SKW80]MDW8453408.1 50S ribosomal protein L31 [Oscillatoriaceae cyanobacterium SKYGB_i_bin93]HIK26763.1 50S ribosomal protein L31 [Oscillatoriaceae cyanobacterium M7585_C2015_266]